MLGNAKPKCDASTGAHENPTMSKADLNASLFELPSLPQIGNHADARPAVAPARWEGITK
jgi:hypothetical protein